MSFSHPRFRFGALCALGIWCGSAVSAEAGLIPWVYDAIFGPPGSQRAYYRGTANYGGPCCGPTYGGAAYGGYGYAGEPSYFAPLPLGLSGPTVAPSPCGPGGCGMQSYYGPEPAGCCGQADGCGPQGCASGQCGVANPEPGFAPITPTPAPSNEIPRTYENNSPSPPDTSPGFRPRGEGTYVPMRDTTTESPEDFQTPVPSTNPSRDPAPAPARPLGEDDAQFRGPALELDGKVTWRATPARTRLVLRANYAGAKVERTPVYPKTDWVTYPGATDVAKK